MQFNKQRWNTLLCKLNIQPQCDEYEKLHNAYSEKHRFYHTKNHISECLENLDWALSIGHWDYIPEIEMALWYHDIVYDTKGINNELASAQLCKTFLQNSGVATDHVETIHNMIMATKHTALPGTESAKLIVDIDLAILGEKQERFLEYESQIRKEYRWVPWFVYKNKRREILSSFLDRPRIYFTDVFYNTFEDQARNNINNSVAKLN